MTSSNLAICVGPCILWSGDAQVVTGAEYAADVSRVTKLLIDDYDPFIGSVKGKLYYKGVLTAEQSKIMVARGLKRTEMNK